MLLREYIGESFSSKRILEWCESIGKLTLPKEVTREVQAIENVEEQAKRWEAEVAPVLNHVWSFFVALCHALQEGEAELGATDAYWMGLIAEVIRLPLGSRRTMEEFKGSSPAKCST